MANRMNILIIANKGSEHINKFHLPLIKRLIGDGNEVTVMCSGSDEVRVFSKVVEIPIERSPFRANNIKAYFIMKKHLQNNRYDLIYCNTLTGGILGRLTGRRYRKLGTKIVYNSHGFHFFSGSSLVSKLMIILEKRLSRYTDSIICINSEDFINTKKYNFKAKNTYLLNGVGVDLNKFSQKITDSAKIKIKRNLNIMDDDFVLCYVAEITNNKNQAQLIKALIKVIKRNPDKRIKLVLVGPNYIQKKTNRLVEKYNLNNNVVLTGWTNNVGDILSITDLYCASSKREGLGLNVIEALAANLPVIASNNRGHREIIQDKINGSLYDLNDISSLEEELNTLINNPEIRQKYSKNSQSTLWKFDEMYILKVLLDILLEGQNKGTRNETTC